MSEKALSIIAFGFALLLFLFSFFLFPSNALQTKPETGQLTLQGQAPFLANISVHYKPETRSSHAQLTLRSATQQLDFQAPAFKKKRHYLLLSSAQWQLPDSANTQDVEVSVKYIGRNTLVLLALCFVLTGIISWLLFRHHPLSYITWGVSYLALIAYISAAAGGFAQYALCASLLMLAHLIWLNPRIILHRTLAVLCYLAIYPVLFISAARYISMGRWQDSELVAVLQSNTQEVLDYISDFIGWGSLFSAALLCVISALWFTRRYRQRRTASPLLNALGLLMLVLLTTGFGFSLTDYPVYRELLLAQQDYQQEIALWQQEKNQRSIRTDIPVKTETDEITVLVIGESLSRHHMSLYGYQRQTNPQLEKTTGLLVFTDAISNHTQTLQSVFHMITNATNSQPVPFSQAQSLINMAQAANIHSHWLSNQTRFGFSNNWISILADEADQVYFTDELSSGTGRNRSREYDENLLAPLAQTLQHTGQSQLIILHLFGNHSSYSKRYPQAFDVFNAEEPVTISHYQLSADDDINHYDNSVLYNDFIMAEIIRQLQQKNCVCTLIYVPDHGENLVHDTAHNARLYDPLMVEIPLLFWASESWQQRYPQKLANLTAHINTPFMNDDIFDTIAGLMNIQTPLYQAERDLSSEHYQIRPRYTLHGSKAYPDTQLSQPSGERSHF